ncbi:hypothetical protein A9Q89_01395 [Gammaproteobacteria bacterium 53_120_T64]|nr:hypothetical protein A9Q89_01395 [Gammaproteobacteria bacterium 53_120_T64]
MISVLVTIITSGVFLYIELNINLKQIDRQLDEVKSVYLPSISSRLWLGDTGALTLDLDGMINLRSIEYLAVTEAGEVLVEAGLHPVDKAISRNYPVFYEYNGAQQEIGRFIIEASSADVYKTFYANALSSVVMVAFQTFLVAGLLLVLVGRRVTSHLVTISAFANQLGLSNLNQQLVLDRPQNLSAAPDEFDVLVEALTLMQQQLSESVLVIKESEENLHLTLNCIGDAVIATDSEGMVSRMNPVAEKLSGWAANEALGCSVREVFSLLDTSSQQPLESPLHQALVANKTVILNNAVTLLAKNSEPHQIIASAAPINNGKSLIGAILVFHDVSEKYRMRIALQNSQKRLRLHVEQTPLAVIEWDQNFNIVDWNVAAEKIFGYSKKEVLGTHYSTLFVAPADRAVIDGGRELLLSKKTQVHRHYKNITKAGDAIDCEWFNTVLMDGDGKVFGVASMVDNISVRVQAEEKNRQQQLEQKLLLDNMLDAVLTVDEEGLVLGFNLSAERLFGYSAEDVIGQHFNMIIPVDITRDCQDILRQNVKGFNSDLIGQPHETWVTNKKGDQLPVRLSIAVSPQVGTDKQLFVATVHDLTREKKIEEQLRRSQKMDALGKLTGGIAHDYNNMLGIVLGYAELLQGSLAEQPKLCAYAEQIQQAGDRGKALTAKLLAFSKQQVAEAVRLDVNALLMGQRHLLEKIVTARITLKMDLQEALWPIWVDRGDFDNVLINLCINAMHAMAAVEGVLSIASRNQSLGARDVEGLGIGAGDYVILAISDTGVGMDPSTLEKIFDPFFTTKGEHGTGLGLSQVYGFVERSEGALQVYSEPGFGTKFSLYFPRYQGDPLLDEVGMPADLLSVSGSETIVVVDDEPGLLELARDVLSQQGYRVLCGSNASEALDLLHGTRVDLLISDVIMPGMNGYQLASIVRAEFPATKILMVSGFDETSHIDEAEQVLKATVLAKPYSTQVLLCRVRELLNDNEEAS